MRLPILIRSHAAMAQTQRAQSRKTCSFRAYINTPAHKPAPLLLPAQRKRKLRKRRRTLRNLKGSALINSSALRARVDARVSGNAVLVVYKPLQLQTGDRMTGCRNIFGKMTPKML